MRLVMSLSLLMMVKIRMMTVKIRVTMVSSLMYIVNDVLPTIIGLLAGMLINELLRRHREYALHEKALMNGVGMLLKIELYDVHDKYPNGNAPDKIKEHIQSVYEAYHELGMNGYGTQMYNDIMNGDNHGGK